MIGWRIATGLLVAFAVLGRSGDASAATFCVGDPRCPADTQLASLTEAALAAGGPAGRDTILIGPGVHEGARFEAGNAVELVGAGRDATLVVPGGGSNATVALADPQSTARGLTVRTPGTRGGIGVRLAGVADDIAVTPALGPAVAGTAVELLDGAAVRGSALDVAVADGALGADLVPGADARLEQVRISGAGVRARAGRLALTRSRIDAHTGAAVRASDAATLRLDTVLVRSLPGAAGGLHAHQPARATETTVIRARHLTLIGAGEADRPALSATASGAGAVALVRVDDSIIRGFAGDRHARAEGGADAFVDVAYSNFDPAGDRIVGAGRLSPFGSGENRTYGSIRFVDAAGGDYRLRGISPVIDRGTPGTLLPDEPPLDLDGQSRIVDGNGAAGATRDMGAFEYQRRPPVLAAGAQPALATVGTPIRFEAQVSDPDPGDEIAVRWVMDDGTVVDGLAGDHVFTTPGAHFATVTATDSGGAVTTRTVLVRTIPVAPVAAAEVPVPPDVVAPRFSLLDRSLRVSKTRRVALRVRCAAGEPEACRGTISLRVRPRGRRATQVVASSAFTVAPGTTRTVRPRLRAAGAKLLRRTGRLRVTVTIDARDQAGNRRVERRTLTLRAAVNAKRGPSR